MSDGSALFDLLIPFLICSFLSPECRAFSHLYIKCSSSIHLQIFIFDKLVKTRKNISKHIKIDKNDVRRYDL